MFLKVNKADMIIESCATAHNLLCLVYLMRFDKNSLRFFFACLEMPQFIFPEEHNDLQYTVAF